MNTSAIDPGAVRLNLRWDAGCAHVVALDAVRPRVATLLRGKPADQAVRMLPLLYSICGVAQATAARLALSAARGAAHAAAVDAQVLAEAQREHLWRLLLDWPDALGLPRQEALFASCRRHLQEDGTVDVAPLQPLLAQIEQALCELPQPAAAIALLPPLVAPATLDLWPRLDADFAAAPDYRGRPAATGAMCRHAGLDDLAPFLRCVRARILDLGDGTGLGLASSATVAPGIGRATVETARGLLMHEIVLAGDNVADYVVVAPTEWNFHPAGALSAWLDGMAAESPQALRRTAARAVMALDPCVRSEIEVTGAM